MAWLLKPLLRSVISAHISLTKHVTCHMELRRWISEILPCAWKDNIIVNQPHDHIGPE